jgi:hypothetical protein
MIQPNDLGTFFVQVDRILRTKTLSPKKYAAIVKRRAEQMQFDQSMLTNLTAVDEVTYSKGGVTSAIEYVKPLHFGRSYR